MDDLATEDRFYLSDGYKRSVLEHMSLPQLLDTLLIHPTVYVSPSYRDTGLTASYSFKPLSNLVYTRDQQVLSAVWTRLLRGFAVTSARAFERGQSKRTCQHGCLLWIVHAMPLHHAKDASVADGLPASLCPVPADGAALVAQITTCKGIVMARLRSTVRELEVALMRFCFEKLGAPTKPSSGQPLSWHAWDEVAGR